MSILTRTSLTSVIGLCHLCFVCACAAPPKGEYFAIEVVDESTGRGVPMVELETVNNLKFMTDSAGLAAFFEPGLMNQKVFFTVKGHGYEMEKDFLGFAGKQVDVTPGGSASLKIKRLNIAQRIYRATGAGIYADSVLLGREPPIKQPLLNAQVFGQDSVQPAVYKGEIYWFWGDTNRPSYPLGNFHTTGARSLLPEKGGLDPAVGINFDYFMNPDAFTKKMIPMPEDKPGPVWTDAVFTAKDSQGGEKLVGHFSRMKDISQRLERGIMIFNDLKQEFESAISVPLEEPLGPQGQAIDKKVIVDGVEHQYFCHWGPPNIRVKADLKSVLDVSQYEAFTPLQPGVVFKGKETKLDRNKGQLVWAWKRGTGTLSGREQKELIDAGLMTADESPYFLRNVDDGQPVTLHSASVSYNAFRQKWIMIGLEIDGTSKLGEVWYAESAAIEGPWKWGKKVVTHNRYSFYNPRLHSFFDEQGGRIVYFEGTFANSISGTDSTTPRYEYNQIMYRLDLDDAGLKPLLAK